MSKQTNKALREMLAPYIAELDRYPRPDRIDPKTGVRTEYGEPGDQHCPTMPISVWIALVAAEPFASDPAWEYLQVLRKEAIGASREIPGAWLRRAYNVLDPKGG